jgi:hypothetical protein
MAEGTFTTDEWLTHHANDLNDTYEEWLKKWKKSVLKNVINVLINVKCLEHKVKKCLDCCLELNVFITGYYKEIPITKGWPPMINHLVEFLRSLAFITCVNKFEVFKGTPGYNVLLDKISNTSIDKPEQFTAITIFFGGKNTVIITTKNHFILTNYFDSRKIRLSYLKSPRETVESIDFIGSEMIVNTQFDTFRYTDTLNIGGRVAENALAVLDIDKLTRRIRWAFTSIEEQPYNAMRILCEDDEFIIGMFLKTYTKLNAQNIGKVFVYDKNNSKKATNESFWIDMELEILDKQIFDELFNKKEP